MNIKILLDERPFTSKEEAKRNAGAISKRIGSQEIIENISTIAKKVGDNGCTWNPCTYLNGRRTKEEFKDCQLFALDFDKGIPYEIIKNKFNEYHIPISFSYHTLSSTPDKPKYRIVLCHESIITDSRIATFILLILKNLFSKEADLSCFELARLYFGGKEVIEVNDCPNHSFNIYDLSCTYQKIMRENDMKHFSEKQQKISKECQIELMGKSLFNLQCFDNSVPWDFKRSSNTIYIELPLKSQMVAISLGDAPTTPHPKNKREMAISRLENINHQKICGICRLWDDFYNGTTHLTHNERFALALNIIHIKGMEKVFFKVHDINYPGSDQIKWLIDIEYAKAHDYHPQNCSFCKYKDSCSHNYSLYETLKENISIYPLNHSHEYVSVDSSYDDMERKLKKILKKNTSNIYLIKAQTGLGKTKLYVDIIKNSIYKNHKPYLIAVPTTSLKTEIYKKIGDTYIANFPSLEDLPISYELYIKIKELYCRGLNKYANHLLEEFYNDNSDFKLIELYLHPHKFLYENHRNVIMTHSRFLQLPKAILRKYEIIIDEDILYYMLHCTGTVHINSLKKGIDNKIFTPKQENKIKKILNIKNDHYAYLPSLATEYNNIEKLDSLNINDNLNALFHAEAFFKTKETIYYMLPLSLEKVKITILSATLNVNLYDSFFPDRIIKFTEIAEAQYKGNLIQYYHYSTSRNKIHELGKQFHSSSIFFKKIIEFVPNYDYAITFKEFESHFSYNTLHFGNVAGIDYYAGKDGIIVGTYHLPESVYKLAACYIHGTGKNLHKQILRRRTVYFNGYHFPMMSYEDKILRNIQLYLISTELEQAIGRSRLLRTNSTIYLFSNFPCQQATLSKIDYLKKGNADALS